MNNEIEFYEVTNGSLNAVFSNQGASLVSLKYLVNGEFKEVLSTPKSRDDFMTNDMSYGATVGQTAGVLHADTYEVNGINYIVKNTLKHGGENKFSKVIFHTTCDQEQSKIIFKHTTSKSAAYPGILEVTITYQLIDNKLSINHHAKPTEDTYCNITFHPYFNLTQEDHLSNHELKINTDYYLGTNELGRFDKPLTVNNTSRDFTKQTKLNISKGNTLNDIWVLDNSNNSKATLSSKLINMDIYTNYEGLVVYSQNRETNFELTNGPKSSIYAGIAIEAQKLQSKFPLLLKDESYDYNIIYEFTNNQLK